MKRIIYPFLLVVGICLMSACNKYETYADLKKRESEGINNFISRQAIEVIDEATFNAQGKTTDVLKNQFVRFTRNGVYMQIVRKGSGTPLENNKTTNVLCRFMEKNILTDSVLVRNDEHAYMGNSSTGVVDVSNFLDKMAVTRTGNTFTASFTDRGMMYSYHGSASVPQGWLVPLSYINLAYPVTDGAEAETAKVRLIVPHAQGTADASASVYPCYYEITYQRDN